MAALLYGTYQHWNVEIFVDIFTYVFLWLQQETFGVPIRILRDIVTGPFKTPKNLDRPGKTGINGIPVLWHRYRPWVTTSELQQRATQELLHKRQGPRRDPEEPEGGKGGARSNDELERGEAGAQTWVLGSLINLLWDTMPYCGIVVCLMCLRHVKTHKKMSDFLKNIYLCTPLNVLNPKALQSPETFFFFCIIHVKLRHKWRFLILNCILESNTFYYPLYRSIYDAR